VEAETGLLFVYDNGASPKRLMVEATGGGAGWLDADNDGWPDLWLVQGGSPVSTEQSQNPGDVLFLNRRGRAFVEVSSRAGTSSRRYSQGMSVGDWNGDGFDDVYVTNVGPDELYCNLGDGTFVEVSEASGVLSRRWGSSAAFADLDQDDDLDLFVCNYTDYDPDLPLACFGDDGKPGICHPRDVDPLPNKLFLNQGDGTFREALQERGMQAEGSKSLGVVIADLTGDCLPDVFVANDTTANHLFVNQGQGRFIEQGMAAGCAASGMGQFQASMGVGFGDYDQDGQFDLYCSHFTADSNTLYRGLPGGVFDDVTRRTDLHLTTMDDLGFGTLMSDFNSDGHMDLVIGNGHIDSAYKAEGDRYEMEPRLFSYDPAANRWQDVAADAGPVFREKLVTRAVAGADYDLDGDMDLVLVNQNQPAILLENTSEPGHWLKLNFVGAPGNRRGVGVEVRVQQGQQAWRQQLSGGTSYCSAHEPALFFGLGSSDQPCEISVRWPDGSTRTLSDVAVDRIVQIVWKPQE
jgi:hypothetical protein